MVRAIAAVALALLAFAPAARADDATITAAADDIGFSPTSVTVNPGDTVTISKELGSASHNSDYDDLAPCPASPTMSAWSCPRTFTDPGDFTFHCDLHTFMMATVHVVVPPIAFTWTGSDNGSWVDDANWSGSGVPGVHSPLDTATIATGAAPVLDQDLTIAGLTLDGDSGRAGSGTLTVTGGNVAWSASRFAGTGTTILGSATTLDLQGDVTVTGSATLSFGGTTTWVGGQLGNADATPDAVRVENLGTMTIDAGGLDDASAGGGTFTNAGTLQHGSAGAIQVEPRFTSSGAVLIAAGSAVFGDFVQTGGSTTVDGALAASPLRLEGGRLSGGGSFTGALENVGGTVAPGSSPGVLAITGSFAQTGGVFEVDLTGTGHDQLTVSGAASVAGTLAIVNAPGFTPVLGDAFTVLTAGSVSGTFPTLAGATVGDRSYVAQYDATHVVLAVPAPAATPAPSPVATPTPPPTPTPAPSAKPITVPVARLAVLPSARRCVRGRKLRIRLRKVKGETIARVRVLVNGKRVAARTGAQLPAAVTIRKLPKGRFTVKIEVRTTDGRRLVGSRRYRACRKRAV